MNTTTEFSNLGRRIRQWAVVSTLAALPFVFSSNLAIGGPGGETAVASNRTQCSLPPFLNVAITEKPNIMLVYDNSVSMSLPAYTKPYDPDSHYYGLFDHEACFTSSGNIFTKDAAFPPDTKLNIAGVWEKNPDLVTSLSSGVRGDVHDGSYGDGTPHTCPAAAPFSGNFMNWASMRRIDLLRKAFIGGISNNSGTQSATYIAAEGLQTGSPAPMAPCFTKSYVGTGVSEYATNVMKVMDGQIEWGAQCAPADEVITAKVLNPGKRIPTTSFASIHRPVKSGGTWRSEPYPTYGSLPLDTHSQTWLVNGKTLVYSPVRHWVVAVNEQPLWTMMPRVRAVLASLTDVISYARAALIMAPAVSIVTPSATSLPTLTDTTSGSTTVGVAGDAMKIKFYGTATDKDATTMSVSVQFYSAADVLLSTITYANADCKKDGGAVLSGSNKLAIGASVWFVCSNAGQTIPSLATDGVQPKIKIIVNAGAAATTPYTNDEINKFIINQAVRADMQVTLNGIDLPVGAAGMPITVSLSGRNAGTIASLVDAHIGLTIGGVAAAVTGSCKVAALAANTGQDLTCAFTVPAGLATNSYLDVVATIDSTGVILEMSESNNTSTLTSGFYVHKASPVRRDLFAYSISVDGGNTSNVPGATETVSVRIMNLGSADVAAKAGAIKIVLSKDSTFGTTDTEVGVCNLPAMKAYSDASYNQTVSCSVTIPSAGSIDPAEYQNSYLAVLVDPDYSTEENIAGNTAGTLFAVRWADPDIRVSAMTVTPNVNLESDDLLDLGDPLSSAIRVEFTVANNGLGGAWKGVELYWSVNNVLGDGDDTLLPTISLHCGTEQTIADGGTLALTCDTAVPTNLADGVYYLFVKLDPDKNMSPNETATGLTNNYSSTTVVVGTSAPGINLITSSVVIPATVAPSSSMTVSFRLTNTGSDGTGVAPTVQLDLIDPGTSTTISTATCVASRAINGFNDYLDMTCTLSVPGTTGPAPRVSLAQVLNVVLTVDPGSVIVETNEADNIVNDTVTVAESATDCSGTACVHNLKIDFNGDGRTGILWTFRAKSSGTLAPANMGITTRDDWETGSGVASDPWQLKAPNSFAGVEENQQPANRLIPNLAAAVPNGDGNLSRLLLNTVKYFAHVEHFQTPTDPMLYDPVINDETAEGHPCRKNYILLISDGYSFNDWDTLAPVPFTEPVADLKDYAADQTDEASALTMLDSEHYSLNVPDYTTRRLSLEPDGSFHADNVARYAHTLDMRPTGGEDLAGNQFVDTIVVHAFAASDSLVPQAQRAVAVMKSLAIQGAYVEKDGIDGPSSSKEWDADQNTVPDAYFEAKEGDDVGDKILEALNSILLKTASGTSVSVIASTSRGEGAVYQSYFRPITAEGGQDINWIGFLQALWVDKYNNLREDTIQDGGLVLTEDRVVEYRFNANSKETFAVFHTTDADGNILSSTEEESLSTIKPIFESGRLLYESEAEDRLIYTWPHWATDVVPAGPPVAFTDSVVDSCTNGGTGDCLMKHLWPASSTYYNDVAMSKSLLRWIRGDDLSDITFRKRGVTFNGVSGVWKLGDIVYSTPTVVGAPEERYDLIYGANQDGYSEYYAANAGRQRLVAVGANDGMLHAFNGGLFKSGDKPGADGKKESAYYETNGTPLGEELWAYIPGSLLPNLRMLADAGYDTTCHVYYVDLKPKVTDVQIFFDSSGVPIDNTYHKNGWGTILIGGMRLGCGISEYASYFILDISNPVSPFLLAEFGEKSVVTSSPIQPAGVTDLSGLDFSFFYPTVLRVEDTTLTEKLSDGSDNSKKGRWFMMVGSGPNSLDHTSDRAAGKSAIYVFDLTQLGQRTGTTPTARKLEDFAYAINEFSDGTPLPANLVISNGVTADLDADFSVDSAYVVAQTDFGVLSLTQAWQSGLYKLITFEDPDPTAWKIANLFDTAAGGGSYSAARPLNDDPTRYQSMTAAPGITRDPGGNIWIYFGTGRFIHKGIGRIDDLAYGGGNDSYQQSLYGLMDPCGFDTNCIPATKTRNDLLNTTNYEITLQGTNRDEKLTCSGPCLASFTTSTCVMGTDCTSQHLSDYISAAKSGWYRDLTDYTDAAWEMAYNKPAVAGGLVLFTTYKPDADMASCTLGGDSYLYLINYQTGTASKDDPFAGFDSTSTSPFTVKARGRIGGEPPSPPSIFGKQVFVQGSNAKITGIKTNATFKLPPHVRGWNEQ